jgi:hypothetical protein
MIGVYYTLKLSFASFIGQLAIGQRTAYTSQLPHAYCQKRWTKSADLLRTQAGRPLVIRA